ncbi:MAG: hypothetical protein NVSMB3_10530 [Acidobacteriaceae bacterium]
MSDLAVKPAPKGLGVSLRYWFESVTYWAERFAASRALVLALFTVVYLLPTIYLSRIKLLWDDEFFTLYLARASSWKSLMQALATGADQHPPSFYYLTHWIMKVFGTGHVTLRLTAIVGFWLMCVCLYEIVRSLTTPMWGIVGMLFPLTTNLYYYATEARGYGLVTGFAALALLCWLKATAYRSRGVYLPLLAFSLAAAVASHYYAAMVVVCLALGDLARSISRRVVDWPVWIAFLFTGLPIALFFRTIQSARGYSSHFWAFPSWSDAVFFYSSQLTVGPLVLLGALSVAVAFGFTAGLDKRSRAAGLDRRAPIDAWQAISIAALSALPFFVMVVAKFVTHGFTERYAIAAIVGVAVLFSYLLFRVAPQPKAAAAAILLCLMAFLLQAYLYGAKFHDSRDSMASDLRVLSTTGDQQIAVVHITVFHQLSFYAPRQIATRVNYVSDPGQAIKYMGHDTIDRGLMDLNPWFPLKLIPVKAFLRDNREFFVYGNISPWSWLTFDLPKWGQTELLERDGQHLLFSVKRGLNAPEGLSDTPAERDAASHMLFLATPQAGVSLCTVYMGPKGCPYNKAVIDAPKCSGDCNTFTLGH